MGNYGNAALDLGRAPKRKPPRAYGLKGGNSRTGYYGSTTVTLSEYREGLVSPRKPKPKRKPRATGTPRVSRERVYVGTVVSEASLVPVVRMGEF